MVSLGKNVIRKLKESLLHESDNKCSYCGVAIDSEQAAVLDFFYPKSKYPEKYLEPENFLISCYECASYKNDQLPITEKNGALLLNPRKDKYEDHITIGQNGFLIGKTEQGESTINLLNLNRPALVEGRKIEAIKHAYLINITETPKNPLDVFLGSITKIRELNVATIECKEDTRQYFTNLLYANVITSLETYLCDRFILSVTSSKSALRTFVESFHDFKQEKFELREIFKKYEEIDKKALDSIKNIIYHDLPKVKGMYADSLGIEMPSFGEIYRSVVVRHDIIHRNGKSKDGKPHTLSKSNVEALCKIVENFVNSIDANIHANLYIG